MRYAHPLRLAIALLAVSLVSQRAHAQRGTDPRLESRLDQPTATSVQAAVDAARSEQLPTEPLVLKALEGASKRAPGPRIVAAVSRLHAQLGFARGALGGASTVEEIVAGTSALQAGVVTGTLGELRAARPASSLATPLAVLADLIGRGVAIDVASSTVLALVRAEIPDSQIVAYRQGVERDIRAGIPPAAAAAAGGGGPPAGIPVTPGSPPPVKTGGPPPPP